MKTKIRKIPRVIISVVLALALLVSSSTAAMIISGASIGRQRTTGASTVVEEGVVEETDNETVGAADDEMVGAAADDDDMVSAAADDDSVGAVAEDNDESVGAVVDESETVGDDTLYIWWGSSNQRKNMKNKVQLSGGKGTIKSSGNTYFLINNYSTHGDSMPSYFTSSTTVTIYNLGGSSWANTTDINDGSQYYLVQYWTSNSEKEIEVTYNSTGNSITLAPKGTDVCSSVTLATDKTDNEVSSNTEQFKLTATVSDVASALSEKSLTYTFYAGGSEIGSATSSTGSASLTGNTQDTRTKKYTVTVSYTGYLSKTSGEVTVTNTGIAQSEFKLVGEVIGNWTTGQVIDGVDPAYGANVYYTEVTVTTVGDNDSKNRFRLLKGSQRYTGNVLSTKIPIDGASVAIADNGTDTSNYLYFNPTYTGTYRIYVDQSTPSAPKVWVTEADYDVFITTSENFYSKVVSGHVSGLDQEYFEADENTGFVAYKHGNFYNNGNTVETAKHFMLSTKKGVDYDLEYAIRDDLCTGVSLTQENVTVGNLEDGEHVQIFAIQSNVMNEYYTYDIILHIDKNKKQIYATACYDQSNVANTAASDKKTITYYFAKEIGDATSGDDKKGFDGLGADSIKIYYYNNSIDTVNTSADDADGHLKKTGEPYGGIVTGLPVKQNGQTITSSGNDNTIYVDLTNPIAYDVTYGGSARIEYNNSVNWGDSSYSTKFYIYKVTIPSWATSFTLVDKNNYPLWRYGSGYAYPGAVLNPNRVYCYYGYTNASENKRKYYCIGARLDDTLWTANGAANADEAAKFIKYEKTNLIKFNATSDDDYNKNMNTKLVDQYKDRGIINEMYFGNFWGAQSGAPTFNDSKTPLRWKIWNNLAQNRNGEGYKYRGDCSYYASIWDLAGGVLDLNRTSGTGGYYLNDTYQKEDLPFFDYDTLSVSGNGIASAVYQNVDFPFYKNTFNGITSYSYDSLSDYNREFNTTSKKYEYVGKIATLNDMQGYKPFSNQDKSFANEFIIKFYMTETGKLKPTVGDDQDITFNFSGDDDVWVYIDGVKVLDLGGAHMISAASINLSEMKTYYRTPARSNFDSSLNEIKETYATNPDFMRTVDIKKLFEVYGIDFDNKDASTQHTLQMFYMERGQNESNCSISFNLPQNSGLRIQNEINTKNVNAGLLADTLRAADQDYFQYFIENQTASDTQVTKAKALFSLSNIPAKATGLKADTSFYSTDPVFPMNNAVTVNRKSASQLLLASGQTGTDSATPTFSSPYFKVDGLTYKLTDAYAVGTIDSMLSGKSVASGDHGAILNLLYGESATFNSKITPHTWLTVKQQNELYYPSSDSKTITKGAAVADGVEEKSQRNVSRFYSTSYTITDDAANKETGKEDLDNNLEVDVSAHSKNDDGYYFSNYSDTTDADESVAATYKFINTPHVGEIDIVKEIDSDKPNLKASFWFTIEFKDIFGVPDAKVGASGNYREYDVKYRVYNSDGSYVERNYSSTHGIMLRHGQTAKILGVPSGTLYKIQEASRGGYELEKITKDAFRSGVRKDNYPKYYTDSADFIQLADIDYQSKDDTGDYLAEFTFLNKPVLIKVTLKYYDRYVHSGGETEISSSPTSYSYTVPDWDTLPKKDADNNNINWYREDDDGKYTYINTKQLITYTTGLADIGNVIAGYTFWTSNTEARTEIAKAEHVLYNTDTKIGNKYSDDYTEAVLKYHTNYIGTPVATAEGYDTSARNADMWVCYKDKSGNILDFDDPSTAANYQNIATIEVWGYNYPKEYSITPHTVLADEDSNELATVVAKYNSDGEVINGSDEPAYIVGTASGTSLSGNLYNTRVGGAYWPHYNADMSNKDSEDAKVILLNRPSEYFQKYGLEKGYTGEYPVTAESFISENKTYKFAYWASDAAGKNKITSDYNYGYRIVKTMDIYPVYFPSDIVKTPSLSLTSLAPDTYTSGSTVYRRINNIVAVSDLEPYDNNLTDVTALYVRLGADSSNTHGAKTELDLTKLDLNAIKHNFQQALAETENWGSAPKTVYIDVTADGETDTRRGTVYRYKVTFADNPTSDQIQVNNKNRMLITHSFKNTLFDDGATFHEMLVFAAVKYDNVWITSDNYAVYVGGVPK